LLQGNVTAFGVLVDIHYRYYQFYANMLVSLAWGYTARRVALGFWSTPLGWPDVGFLLLAVVFFLGSRDTLGKYYARTEQFLTLRKGPEPTASSLLRPGTPHRRKRRAG
jgi:hypothetical protein